MIPAILSGRPPVRWVTGACAITADGTSLTQGQGGGGITYLSVLAGLAPVQGTSTPTANIGVPGQTAAQMRDSRADVASAHIAGRTNVLLAEGLTNSVYLGATPQQAVTDFLGYAAAVKADRAWRVVLQTAIPRYQPISGGTITQTTVDALNALLDQANNLLRAQWRGVADALIDLRAPGSPFAFADYTAATFDGSGLYIQETTSEGTIRTHCSPAGYTAWGTWVAPLLRRVPAR